MSRIAELREQAGLTQRQLADIIDVDPSTVRNWERNRNATDTFVKIAKLCDTLRCGPHDLFAPEEVDSSTD